MNDGGVDAERRMKGIEGAAVDGRGDGGFNEVRQNEGGTHSIYKISDLYSFKGYLWLEVEISLNM